MNDLIVIMGSSVPPDNPRSGTLSLYLSQLAAAGIETHLLHLSSFPTADGGSPGNLELFIRYLREFANRFANYERIIVTDAWDVLFYGTKENVLRNIPMDRPMIAAAKECYPWGLAERQPREEDTNRLYANGGMIAGTPETFLILASAMERHPAYHPNFENQGMMNIMIKEGTTVFHHDNRTKLFFTLFDGYEELDFENGIPINTLYETHPAFLHANGHWPTDQMSAKWRKSLSKQNI